MQLGSHKWSFNPAARRKFFLGLAAAFAGASSASAQYRIRDLDVGTVHAGTITSATMRTSASDPRTEINGVDHFISVDAGHIVRVQIKNGILSIFDDAGNLAFSIGASGIAICDSVGTLAAYHNLTLSAPLGYVDINALGLRVNGVSVTVP
jgi:hypothetical protein